ncbi:fungal specific transcription factor domain containing protein [Sporothrix brasiliensis 5110]|uniref:Fungal specific transcription factor domain containing protein n=1 Tax=Sporothrix brasiliensis 5110 TaxID=1398154 RepID=A0A0C2IJC0_9PEZI|nr:fungal specific transcription factor domain containing protein [Sporothrix brasiliensis 5110]KIH87060.1 fungal specific transcription factor domain containing protein [Sporothrix brasiliensis 5110]
MPSLAKALAPRQSTACQWCRAHKLKCDAEQPSCRNCARRSVVCVTTNLRKPDAEGRRQLPEGRRRRYHQTPSATPKVQPGRECPALLPSPSHRTFGTRSPDRILPGHFATPFGEGRDEDEASIGPTMARTDTHGVSATAPTTGGTNSLCLLVQWLDLFMMKNPAWQPVFPHFRHGLVYASEIPLPSPYLSIGTASPGLPPIPAESTMRRYTETFFTKIHPLFPIVDHQDILHTVARLGDSQTNDYGLLACTYALCSLAADEEHGGVSDDGTRYLEAAYGLYAHLVARPSISSVQALLLLTLALRNRNKDAVSWGSLGQAIRLAQAIQLHRNDSSNVRQSELASRLWWTAYIMERTMELETGRPSAIRDDECDRRVPKPVTEGFDYFGRLIELAHLKTRVIHLLYRSSGRRPVKDLLFEMGHLDRALLDWADTFPESVRPGRDLFCSSGELPRATYVSLQFHQTLIALHRPALMSAPGFLRNRINTYCAGTPLRDRLHFSLCIGAASARALLKATNDLFMYSSTRGKTTRLITADVVLLGVLTLGIYATKVSTSRLNRSDLALVDTFGALVEDEYRRAGHNAECIRGIQLFRTQLSANVDGTQGPSPATTTTVSTQPAGDLPPPDSTSPAGITTPAASMDEFGFDLSMDATDLESSWARFWDEDFDKLLAMPGVGGRW